MGHLEEFEMTDYTWIGYYLLAAFLVAALAYHLGYKSGRVAGNSETLCQIKRFHAKRS